MGEISWSDIVAHKLDKEGISEIFKGGIQNLKGRSIDIEAEIILLNMEDSAEIGRVPRQK